MAAGQYSRDQVLELVLSDDSNEDMWNGRDEEFGLLEEKDLGHNDDTVIKDDRSMEDDWNDDKRIENDETVDGIMFDEMVCIEEILEDMGNGDLLDNGNDMDEDDFEGDAESYYDTDEN